MDATFTLWPFCNRLCAPEPVWNLWRGEIYFPSSESNPDSLVVQLVEWLLNYPILWHALFRSTAALIRDEIGCVPQSALTDIHRWRLQVYSLWGLYKLFANVWSCHVIVK
jgi:hypothetical protein